MQKLAVRNEETVRFSANERSDSHPYTKCNTPTTMAVNLSNACYTKYVGVIIRLYVWPLITFMFVITMLLWQPM